jgi:hypothetical protein
LKWAIVRDVLRAAKEIDHPEIGHREVKVAKVIVRSDHQRNSKISRVYRRRLGTFTTCRAFFMCAHSEP